MTTYRNFSFEVLEDVFNMVAPAEDWAGEVVVTVTAEFVPAVVASVGYYTFTSPRVRDNGDGNFTVTSEGLRLGRLGNDLGWFKRVDF